MHDLYQTRKTKRGHSQIMMHQDRLGIPSHRKIGLHSLPRIMKYVYKIENEAMVTVVRTAVTAVVCRLPRCTKLQYDPEVTWQ